MSNEEHIKNLLKARLDGSITAEEEEILAEWIGNDPQHAELVELLEESTEWLPTLGRMYGYDEAGAWKRIRREVRRRILYRTMRAVVAAAAVAGVAVGVWRWQAEAELPCEMHRLEQLAPGVRGALLTLSSGEQVALDTAEVKTLVEQDGTRIEIEGERLAYCSEHSVEEPTAWNRVSVPRGREFSLQLSDGTRVWLNSESELAYPVRFGTERREVEISGEAFFDVAPDVARQFVVKADTVSVAVFGTAFNLAAYADESSIETTLVRGSVEVASGERRIRLDPGQQARVERSGALFEVREVEAEEYAAWIRGTFVFHDEPLASICRKFSRWYDVEIVPRDEETGAVRYTGEVKRYDTFAGMARLLEQTNQIRVTSSEGRIILGIGRVGG